MTKEETVKWLESLKSEIGKSEHRTLWHYAESIDMAIEALSQPIVVKHFDIQSGYIYCSPQNAENVEVVVRCKDCRYRNGKVNRKGFEVCDATGMDITDEDFCSFGERREKNE